MLDFNHLVSRYNSDIQTFIGTSDTVNANFELWKKPRGISFIRILCLGGGGIGFTAAWTREKRERA